MSRRTVCAPTLPKRLTLGLLFLLLGAAACDVPNFSGPQLQDPPQGFLLNPNPDAPHSLLAYRPAVYHDAWVQSLSPYSTIQIYGFSGVLTLEDMMTAQDSLRGRPHDPDIRFGALEPLSIDGRDAWGWEERIDTPIRGIPWVAYRVMVPYDTISYTIEFSTEDPLYKAGAPESLKAVIFTFAVGETVWNWPLIALGFGLLLFAIHISRTRANERAARLKSINLVKIKKKEEPAGDASAKPEEEPVTAGQPSGTSPQ